MNINNISAMSCKGNPLANAKTFRAPLKDGSEAIVKVSDNAYECLITKNKQVVGGMGACNPKGVGEDLASVMSKINANVKEGFDFLGEFIKAVIK